MLIKFISTQRISEDGKVVRLCEAGQVYDLADSAACAAMRKGWAYNAEPFDDKSDDEVIQSAANRCEMKNASQNFNDVMTAMCTAKLSETFEASELLEKTLSKFQSNFAGRPTNPQTFEDLGKPI